MADNGDITAQGVRVDTGADGEWWLALRRIVTRLLDVLEATERSDAAFRADLMLLLGRTAQAASQLADAESVLAAASPAPAGAAGAAGTAALPPDERTTAPPTIVAGAPGSGVAPGPPIDAARSLTPHGLRPSPLVGPRVVVTTTEAPPGALYPRQWTQHPFDPTRLAASCRLKAQACRWQSRRRELLDAGEDVYATDHELVDRARAADVWLWMVSPTKWRERTDAAFATVAGCYDALADAAELMGMADRLGQQQELSLRLLAEAQSSVRAAVEDYGSTKRDEDQAVTFAWLREQTDVRRVYVEYMQLDNTAPPENHEQLRRRVGVVREQLNALLRRDHTVETALKRIGYHVKKLGQRPTGEPLNAAENDVVKIADAVADLTQHGVAPSDVRLRDLLTPVFDRLAELDAAVVEQAAPTLRRVLEEIGEYLDQRSADEEALIGVGDADAAGGAMTAGGDALVAQARDTVGGRDAVMIGGIPSELHRARLERGLGLRSLNWIRVEHHEPFDAAANAIRRPGVGLIMIMTRWRSHRDGPAARDLSRKLGIPLVELPAGYNLRRVAHEIVKQISPQPESEG